ncbi:MAG: 30S ribosomal protein S2 [Candidatus Diapherotrites archaeon]
MTDIQEDNQNVPVANPAIEKYLTTGAHIGTRFKSGDMLRYIYKQRKDGLKVLDVQVIDERVKQVGQFLSKFDSKKIVIVSRKLYGKTPAEEFAKSIGAYAITGRFVPGTFTNPEGKEFIQPQLVIITEPESDAQAIAEASKVRAVVVALASTNNVLANVDVVIPINNKGRKSLALVYWLLAKEIMLQKGDIPNEEAFPKKVEDFEYPIKDGEGEDRGPKRKRRERKFTNRYEAAAGLGGDS